MPRGHSLFKSAAAEVEPSEATAAEIIDWIEKLIVPDGKLLGQQFKLGKWQREFLAAIYDNPAGTRRAILSCARKSGKTALSAALVLVHLVGPKARQNAQLFSTAQSREQAAIIFNLAAKIIRMTAWLRGYVTIKESVKQLVCNELGTSYRALSAEHKTSFGLSPSLHLCDELGQVRGPRSSLFEALETASAAQQNPLSVIISTQAPQDTDLLSILIDDALAGHDPRVVVRLYTAPKEADPFSLEAIRAANPAFEQFMNKNEVLSMAEDARRMPAREAQYRNLVLNQRVESVNPFVQPDIWRACGGDVADVSGKDIECFAGLDLSEANDLTALVIIGRIKGVWHVKPIFWLPGENIAQRARVDHNPYDHWAAKGFIHLTPGASVQYDFVAHELVKIFERYNIRKIAFDRWNFRHLRPWLVAAGFSEGEITKCWVEFGQGTQSMSPALRELESIILERQLCHGDNPVLNMCSANAVIEGKDSSNRKLSKKRSTGRIDGMVSLAMAIGVAPLREPAFDVAALIG
jgi:phage terminase large subunit-like protein